MDLAQVGFLNDDEIFERVPMFASDSIAADNVDADIHIRNKNIHLTAPQANLISTALQPNLIGAPGGIAGLDEHGDLLPENIPVLTFEFTQTVPADAWLVQHNLGGTPLTILAVDNTGEQIVGWQDTILSTLNLLVYRFSEPLTGKIFIKF